MPRSVYKPPFHRRVLPWVFVAIFVIAAPILVFYTSGYRLNPKKVAIERSGTLIADSIPTGARIMLNGTDTERSTPATIQVLTPGPYHVRYQMGGRLPWEKTLDVRAQQATFVDHVRLWRDASVERVTDVDLQILPTNDEGDLIGIKAEHASGTTAFALVFVTSTGETAIRPNALPARLYELPRGRWTAAEHVGSFVILNNGTRWMAVKRGGEPEPGTAEGDRPRWNDAGAEPRALLLNGNEAWLWTPGNDPQLLLRQSEPFVDGAWHRDGYHVFLATDDRVFVLELDDRGGRRADDLVSSLQSIKDVAVIGTSLYVSGTQAGVTGIFKRELE